MSRRGRHLVRGVVAAVGDVAGKRGGQGVFAFFGMDEVHRVAIEGNGEDCLSVGASAPNGEDGVGVCVEIVVFVVATVRGREDVDE